MDRVLEVHVDRGGEPVLAGRLWSRVRSARETSSFEYEPGWLARSDGFALGPDLPLGRGQFHATGVLFGAFTDPAPDRWGQNLLRRAERARAREHARAPRTLFEIDFLVLVEDETRLGAVRVRELGTTEFVTRSGRPVPPLIELPRLLAATDRIVEDRETDDDLALVLAPGTSLGGARPKASVRDPHGHLLVAKFPREDDAWPVTRWEAAAIAMAEAAGVTTPAMRLETVARRAVIMVQRFDRDGARRVPFISGMTAVSGTDGEGHSYLELADFLRAEGAEVDRDLEQLWRRVVFNILISNTDDHLRNHGFLRDPRGWRLSPAFDLNPVPIDVKPRSHALAIDETDPTSSLATALAVAAYFGVEQRRAKTIAHEVAAVATRWRAFAKRAGLEKAAQDRMASAFEHDDLKLALK